MLHILKSAPTANILVKSQYIDHLLVYILHQMQFINEQKEIFIQTGRSSNNSIKIINVRAIFQTIDARIINALPGWFAYTGCAYEPCFYGKGKKSSFKALMKDESIQNAFSQLGSSIQLDTDTKANLERYTCLLYNSNTDSVVDARVNMFEKAYNVDSLQMDDFTKGGKNIY